MADVLVNEKEVERYLNIQKNKSKKGDIIDIIVAEDLLEKLPSIVNKYGFSIVDGDNIEARLVRIVLEFRQLF
ncbi:hypothetical protein BFU36_05765 [Sulfolobus sp. A20]|uniref:hypothetical protein n=1 Tax=Saccharolobus sp. A20 TaxID=1891280 RepID=UPI0008460A97|nr:hypothetical protein [Sulfolobus sp. A20]TRM76901.1 hypothetical protein DJ528_07735 [Sulfolobus sp. B5]TRM77370.1 hypothetical protein DJ532_04865 [Sulfolobus sp. A20-N-F8]TRM80993.1 hypothetical protein DJ524_05640 [Sulfolobus sp. D5]TRM87644.1 hypothetical protein DJ521_03260 [Sulfolobus sp. E3]TRM89782.1 hypothetical protein DJ529_00845 [Sulfolobus sp. C3]TRN02460.1 hypothetical protein DJ527_04030 [Sulfolobus sp. F1]TRN04208.1 hypothetical protein DJ530_01120 [Sulfolobus sp. E1]